MYTCFKCNYSSKNIKHFHIVFLDENDWEPDTYKIQGNFFNCTTCKQAPAAISRETLQKLEGKNFLEIHHEKDRNIYVPLNKNETYKNCNLFYPPSVMMPTNANCENPLGEAPKFREDLLMAENQRVGSYETTIKDLYSSLYEHQLHRIKKREQITMFRRVFQTANFNFKYIYINHFSFNFQ